MAEIIIPLPDVVEPTRSVRGMMIVSSQQLIRELGHEEQYWANLSDADEHELRMITVSTWAPIDLAVAHYAAIEKMDLPDEVAFRNGMASGDKVNKAFIGTLIRSMRAAGTISPLTLLSRYDRMYGRLVQGGAVRVISTGPKDARAEMHAQPLCQFSYVRSGWRGIFQGAFQMMSRKVFVREGRSPGPDSVAYDVSWV